MFLSYEYITVYLINHPEFYDLWKVLLVVFVNAGQIRGTEGIFVERGTNQGSEAT